MGALAQFRQDPKFRIQVISILLIALILRLVPIPIRGIHHPDELWQYLEPAHRIAFGRWVEAWEFRAGIRTWLIPYFLAGPMWLGDKIAPDTNLYLWLPKAILAILSLAIVGSFVAIGERISRTHALVAGIVSAVWVDFVYFGARPLSDTIATSLVFPVAAILMNKESRARALVVAGVLLGLAFSVRFQLAPALVTLVFGTTWGRVRRVLPLLLGGAILGLGVDAVADIAAGQTPFRWVVENFRINLLQGKSGNYGSSPPWGYFINMLVMWQVLIVIILPLSAWGARRFPVLLLVAVVNIAVHSAIPHKEYRFILLSAEIIVLLAVIGSVDLARRLEGLLTPTLCGVWLLLSASVAFSGIYLSSWRGSDDTLDTLNDARNMHACGVATFDMDPPLATAFTYYHLRTPMLAFGGASGLEDARATRSFDVLIAYPGAAREIDPAFQEMTCRHHPGQRAICLSRRNGGCHGSVPPSASVNSFLARNDD